MLRLPGVALALASLGFLGLGAQPPTPDWGLLLAGGTSYVERAPWTTTAPAAALALASVIAVRAPRSPRAGTDPPRGAPPRDGVAQAESPPGNWPPGVVPGLPLGASVGAITDAVGANTCGPG